MPCIATRQISHEGTGPRASCSWRMAARAPRSTSSDEFLAHAQRALGGRDEETDWILESWAFTLDALGTKPELLIGGVDWISKKWLLETFRESEGLTWQDPWLQSLDLEYHNINPAKGLFFALTPAKGDRRIQRQRRASRKRCAPRPPTPARTAAASPSRSFRNGSSPT